MKSFKGDYFGEILFEMTCVPWDKAKFYESDTAAKLNFIENAEAEKYVQYEPRKGFSCILLGTWLISTVTMMMVLVMKATKGKG